MTRPPSPLGPAQGPPLLPRPIIPHIPVCQQFFDRFLVCDTKFMQIYGNMLSTWRERSGELGGVVGRNMAEIRALRMWTQGRLAEEAGVSPTTISGIESGRISRPHFGTLRKLPPAPRSGAGSRVASVASPRTPAPSKHPSRPTLTGRKGTGACRLSLSGRAPR